MARSMAHICYRHGNTDNKSSCQSIGTIKTELLNPLYTFVVNL